MEARELPLGREEVSSSLPRLKSRMEARELPLGREEVSSPPSFPSVLIEGWEGGLCMWKIKD
jgi:hypothetical protein